MTDLAPSTVPVQQEAVQFNQPVSEASLAAIGGIPNYLLSIQPPVGTIWASLLFDGGDGTHPNVNFQAQLNNPSPATWVLADGRSVVGSKFQSLTGLTNVPDMRGQFVRASNYGGSAAGTRSDGQQNPDGTLSPGTQTTDKFASHTHVPTSSNGSAFVGDGNNVATTSGSAVALVKNGQALVINNTGGNETAPKNVTVNYFIRIN